jgi:beta-glucosidase
VRFGAHSRLAQPRSLLVAFAALVGALLWPSAGRAQSTLLSQGRPAVSSSVEGPFTAASAVDGSAGTRWSSAASDPQWIYVDLGATASITRVVLNWETAHARAFEIQVSGNAMTWSSIHSTANGTGGVNDLTVSGTGRYVRMLGTARATPWGYSLWEFQVYGSAATSSSLLSQGRTVTVSSSEGGLAPAAAVDGNAATRWGSAFSDPQWIYVDLGAAASINRVVLNWEAAFARSFRVEVSDNASSWTTIYSTTAGTGGVNDLSISGTGRYVRMLGTARATAYGYSLWEFQVYGSGGAPPPPPVPSAVLPNPLPPTPWDAQINSLLAQMTQAEKISLLAGGAEGGVTPPIPRLGILSLRMSDGPHGIRGGTLWPTLIAAAGSFDPALEQQVGAAMGKEFRALGYNVALGPMLNLVRDGRWGRASETYSEDPFLSGKMAAARIRGIQSVGVIANAKHFACNNIEEGRGNLPVQITQRALRELYTYGFKIAVQEGTAWSVMASYNQVNGAAATANNHLLTRILKNDWGFTGFVVSDWGATFGNTVGAAWGGTDIEMPGAAAFSVQNLSAAVANGIVPQALIDDKVRRILLSMFRAGMFAPGYTYVDSRYTGIWNTAEQKALERQAGRAGIVLARNTGALLPLDPNRTQRVAVIGPFANTARFGAIGSGFMTPHYAFNPLQGIQARAAGSNTTVVTDNWMSADIVVIVVGINDEGEGFDRSNLALPVVNGVDQNALVAQVLSAKPDRTVVVYTGGSASMAGSWSNAPAVVIAFYPGQEQGNSLADVLFGDHNPAGRLSVTFPANPSQVPPWGVTQTVYEGAGEGRGYFYHDRNNLVPLFPFGHGLSYTSFQYSNLRVSPATIGPSGTITVQVDVQNTGARAGEEVVQLYVADPVASVERRVKDLRGFQRVAFAPGERKTVTFTLREPDLAFWNDATSAWLAEAGAFNVLVGASSRDIRLQGSFNLVR